MAMARAHWKFLSLTPLLLLTAGLLSGQIANPSRIYRAHIEVRDTNHVTSEVSITGPAIKNRVNYYIHYNSLERITDYSVDYMNEKGRWKNFRKGAEHDFQTTGDLFYSCSRALALELPPEKPFLINYSTFTPSTILLGSLPFTDQVPIDTFYFQLTLPERYRLVTKLINPGLLNHLRFDSAISRQGITYFITAAPSRTQIRDNLTDDLRLRRRFSRMIISIVPAGFAGTPTDYFADWFLQKCSPLLIPDSASKRQIDRWTTGLTNQDSIIRSTFNFVRDHIKYLSVVIGYGSFIPHDVNKILTERQGDCKDMSALLTAALRYKGIDAFLALCATSDHKADFDFPSVSSGNHMICVARLNDRWFYLDATRKAGSYLLPPAEIQGRHLLLLKPNGSLYLRVPEIPAHSNRENYRIEGTIKQGKIHGTLQMAAYGGAMQGINALLANTPPGERKSSLRALLEYRMAGCSFSDLSWSASDDSILVSASFILSPGYFSQNGKTFYLSLGFLPVHPTPIPPNHADSDLLLGYNEMRKFSFTLRSDHDLTAVTLKPVNYTSDHIHLSLNASKEKDAVTIHALFRCEKTTIPFEEFTRYEEEIRQIPAILSHALVFQ